MITHHDIRLALPSDARRVAVMSRDFIEVGLGWRWTSDRILKCLYDDATNVVVAAQDSDLAGFAIMEYADESAHLLLLAVREEVRRQGVGTTLMSWLEQTALVAGIGKIYLEARTRNDAARAFYRELGYREIKLIRRFYRGQEDCIRMAKDLWRADARSSPGRSDPGN
jgi:ribosomal-protein-alanine N-acetyltransferase